MNDENLKKFLHENSNVPRPPVGEWSKILMKIESKEKTSFFSLKKMSLSVASLAVFVIIASSTFKSQQLDHRMAKLDEINTYLVADSYFDEYENEYSWVDE